MDALTAEQVRFRLRYDPDTGVFTWRNPNSPCPVSPGDVAGSVRKDGRVMICVDRVSVFAHILAWLYMTGKWPEDEIDHEDTDPGNNRWVNLRPATSSLNKVNTGLKSNNTSGYKGVSFYKAYGRYMARIGVDGRQVFLGYFDDPAVAHAAYVRAALVHYGEYARAG